MSGTRQHIVVILTIAGWLSTIPCILLLLAGQVGEGNHEAIGKMLAAGLGVLTSAVILSAKRETKA